MLLPLQRGILYGPVHSRRYGRSLGINLMPSQYKFCSFNCIYCHYGWTKTCTMDVSKHVADMPVLGDVVQAVEEALKSSREFELITFSGNGEPTLYPEFAELVDGVVKLRDKHRPFVSVALLSNATGLVHLKVRESIAKLDLPVFKLDCGTEQTFLTMNRPAKTVRFDEIVESLALMKDIYLQTVMIDGTPSKAGHPELQAYIDKVGRIRPREVHMYSIDRPTPGTRIALAPPERLGQIAAQVEAETGIPVRAFAARK
jgi:wyosine [tRNA(Phe)-imidazoG37] synthetase (radical SAM superfamily)